MNFRNRYGTQFGSSIQGYSSMFREFFPPFRSVHCGCQICFNFGLFFLSQILNTMPNNLIFSS